MWQLLLNFIGGPVIKGLIDSYKLKLEAKGKEDQMAVDLAAKEIEGEIKNRQEEASLIRQEQGWWVTALPRPLFAFIFVIYIGKCVVWDKVFGLGSTDPLSPELSNIEMIIIGGYFGGRTIEKVARIFSRR